MDHDELVEAARQTGLALDEAGVALRQATEAMAVVVAKQQTLVAGLEEHLDDDHGEPLEPWVKAPDVTSMLEQGKPAVTEIVLSGSSDASVIAVGGVEPADAGSVSVASTSSTHFAPAEGFHALAGYTYTAALDDDPEVKATGRVMLDPQPVEPEPPPTGGYACKDPHIGAIRKLGQDKRVIVLLRGTNDPPLRAFEAIKDKVTRAVYMMGSVNREPYGVFDHSASGMDGHAEAVWKFFKARREGGAKVLWWDLEGGGTSRNVQASVGYNATRDKGCAAAYFYNTREALRQEAIRWQGGICARVLELAKADGMKDFEHASYNTPNRPVTGSENNIAVYQQMAREALPGLSCPYHAFGGPAAYFSGNTEAVNGGKTLQDYLDWRCTIVRNIRKAFGPKHRIVPAIWAYWFIASGPKVYPNNDRIVPTGRMGALAEGLLEAGANGFVIWRSSGDDDNAADAAKCSKRYEEVVEVIQKDGKFVGA